MKAQVSIFDSDFTRLFVIANTSRREIARRSGVHITTLRRFERGAHTRRASRDKITHVVLELLHQLRSA
jgi:transcriptional regulator with XRE-family HTH domain